MPFYLIKFLHDDTVWKCIRSHHAPHLGIIHPAHTLNFFGLQFKFLCFPIQRKLSMGLLCDTAGLGQVLGQVIGRWGNFFNREAFGGYTDGLFAMQLPLSAVRSSDVTDSLLQHVVEVNGISYIQVHPTFLYESLWNLILLILLILFTRHKRFDGEVFLLYLAGYGIGRFWIESLRTDQLLLPVIGYPVSMALAALLVVVSVSWIIIWHVRQHKKTA